MAVFLAGVLAAADAEPADPAVDPDFLVFRARCAGCHLLDRRLVGPPLREVAPPYAGKVEDMVEWLRKPGRRRTNYPPMLPIAATTEDLRAAARHVLKLTGTPTQPAP